MDLDEDERMETEDNTLVPDDIPTLEPLPMDQQNHETIFINETKLTELKQDFQKHKIEVRTFFPKLLTCTHVQGLVQKFHLVR